MNIYELENLATPGEYKVDRYGEQLYIDNAEDPGDEPVWMLRADDASKEDLVLVSHCRNNFMKALEALKQVADEIQYEHAFSSSACATCLKFIKELEEVE